MGAGVPVTVGPRRSGDAVSLVSGSEKAGQLLGWKPERSSLETMIADAYRWHRGNGYSS